MELRNPSCLATSEQVSSKTPESSTTLISNHNKVTPLITTLNHMCFVKVDGTIYLLWSSMVLPVFRGNKLGRYIFGTKKCPEMIIGEGDEESLNPAFED